MQITQKIGRFVYEDLLNSPHGLELKADTELLIDGLVDSLGVVRLAAFIEQEFGKAIPPQDITLKNFRSLAAIEAYLERHAG